MTDWDQVREEIDDEACRYFIPPGLPGARPDAGNPPRREFRCPHCGLVQTRVWPLPRGNACNACQLDMD